jgi:putative phage-type endonuclease
MITQGSPEWFEQRLGHVTASKMSDVLAKGKSGEAVTRLKYRMQIIAERITGRVSESFSSAAMEWGTEQEPFARMRYAADTGRIVDEAEFYTHPTIKWLGASPDGLLNDTGGLLEIKCPNTQTHLGYLLDKKVPAVYINQMQTQMWVTGRAWCDFVSFDPRVPNHLQLFIVRLDRDDDLIERMETEVHKFLSEVENSLIQLEKTGCLI